MKTLGNWSVYRRNLITTQHSASNQLALHPTKLLTDLSPLGSVLALPLKLILGKVPMTEVCRRDPRSTRLSLCTSAGPAMEAAPAVLFVSRTLSGAALTCPRTAKLPRPVRPEPPLETDGHVVFCQHQ